MRVTQRTIDKFDRLMSLFEGESRLLIVMQDNPDPDSIAAAVALRKLVNTLTEVKCSIAHGGTIGRGENRALFVIWGSTYVTFTPWNSRVMT